MPDTLLQAARRGDAKAVHSLLSGDSVNIAAQDLDNEATALHYAVHGRHVDIAEVLLAHGANPNAPDADGRTALHHAAAAGSDQLIHLLLANNANPTLKDNLGRTAADIASYRGYKNVAAMMRPDGRKR